MQLGISISAISQETYRCKLKRNTDLHCKKTVTIDRVDDVWAKLRQPALTTTFLKKVRFQRTTGVTSVTPKLVFVVVAWTAM